MDDDDFVNCSNSRDFMEVCGSASVPDAPRGSDPPAAHSDSYL